MKESRRIPVDQDSRAFAAEVCRHRDAR